jgi:hypothetical protein
MFSGFLFQNKKQGYGMLFVLLLCAFSLCASMGGATGEPGTPGSVSGRADKTLPEILNGTAAYCEKLKKEVFHFLCREQIIETCEKAYDFPFERRGLKDFFERNKSSEVEEWAASKSKMERLYDRISKAKIQARYKLKKHQQKNIFLNEYRILKDGNSLKEQRTVIELNGKKVTRRQPVLRTVVYSYKNTLYPIYLFAREHQGRYRYKLVKQTETMNRKAWLIEVKSKKGNEIKLKKKGKSSAAPGILAKAWVDADDFSLLKLEVFPEAFRGFDYLLGKLSGKFDIKINDVHFFGFQKNGIRFPSKTEIHLSYKEEPEIGFNGIKHGAVILNNITTIYTYKDYLFYRAKPSEPVFKKRIK